MVSGLFGGSATLSGQASRDSVALGASVFAFVDKRWGNLTTTVL